VADIGPGEPRPAPAAGGPAPDPEASDGAVRSVLRAALVVLAVVSVGLVVQLAVISPLEYRASQVSLLNSFRTEVALGTAPLGPVGPDHHLLSLGTPVALLTIPSIGVRAVVVEGTAASVLAKGPGHFRNTVFPGGAGTSVILGRATAFGGPFGRIAQLRRGQLITVTTQVGTSRFRVVRVRPAGARVVAGAPAGARLTLGTASGPSFAPSGVLWVDADKVGAPLAAAAAPAVQLLPGEQPLATDTSTLWALFLWLEALVALLAGAVWAWRSWGKAQTWIVFAAPMLLVWTFIADQIVRLLPNLL
jgi:LPXTG-site transpeptidase (sortase) family protein